MRALQGAVRRGQLNVIQCRRPYCPENKEIIENAKEIYEMMKKKNSQWAHAMKYSDPQYFDRLAQNQRPYVLWVGCSDSRVPPTDVTGLRPGDIFVHRNVANLVHHADVNFLSVLQYAVEVLKIPQIIVVGHYGCGGVRHALTTKSSGLINRWLMPIKELYQQNSDELEKITDPSARENRLIELSVEQQVLNICKTTKVQRAWKNNGCSIERPDELNPKVHGWVYDIKTGLVKDLKVDVTKMGRLHLIDFED